MHPAILQYSLTNLNKCGEKKEYECLGVGTIFTHARPFIRYLTVVSFTNSVTVGSVLYDKHWDAHYEPHSEYKCPPVENNTEITIASKSVLTLNSRVQCVVTVTWLVCAVFPWLYSCTCEPNSYLLLYSFAMI